MKAAVALQKVGKEKAIDLVEDPDREADYRTRLDLYLSRKPTRAEGSLDE